MSSYQFSKAQQLLGHFLGSRFFAKYEQASLKNGTQYLKAIHLEPETPTINSGWTTNGTLKKTSKKRIIPTPKNGDEVATDWRQDGDDKTLQAANSLGLEPVFNPTKTLPTESKTTYTLDHAPEPRFFNLNLRQGFQEYFEERAGIMEYDGGLSRVDAETAAEVETIIKYSLNDNRLDATILGKGKTA